MPGRPPSPEPTSDPPDWVPQPGRSIWVGGGNASTRRIVEPWLTGRSRPPQGPVDAVVVTPLSVEEAVYFSCKHAGRLVPEGTLIVISPEATSPPTRDLADFETRLRESMETLGLIESPVKTHFGPHLVLSFQKSQPPKSSHPVKTTKHKKSLPNSPDGGSLA